jgi:heat shock transcription factor
MTTAPQPATQNGRSRKRPLPETTAPLTSTLPATAGPQVSVVEMNYYNSLPTSTAGGSTGNIYASDPATSIPASQGDIYRHQGTAAPQGNIYQPHDTNNQIARVPRGNQLVRMPSFNGMAAPSIPAQMMPGQIPMNMNLMGTQGMMGSHSSFEQQVGTNDAIDRELFARIESMKKKRANIPPFVLKLSRYGGSRPLGIRRIVSV